EAAHDPRHGGETAKCADAYRSRSLPDPARDRCLRDPGWRRPRQDFGRGQHNSPQYENAGERPRQFARDGQWDERIFSELCHRALLIGGSVVSDPGRTVPFLYRSLAHHARDSNGFYWGAYCFATDRNDAQRDVAHGCADAGRHFRVEQHSDRRVRAPPGRTGEVGAGSGGHFLSCPAAACSDDFARNHYRHGPHGPEVGRRERAICAIGASHYRRAHGKRGVDGFHRASRISAGVWTTEAGGRPVAARVGDENQSTATRNGTLRDLALPAAGPGVAHEANRIVRERYSARY